MKSSKWKRNPARGLAPIELLMSLPLLSLLFLMVFTVSVGGLAVFEAQDQAHNIAWQGRNETTNQGADFVIAAEQAKKIGQIFDVDRNSVEATKKARRQNCRLCEWQAGDRSQFNCEPTPERRESSYSPEWVLG